MKSNVNTLNLADASKRKPATKRPAARKPAKSKGKSNAY
jgi:hypothetical protein